MRHTDEGIMLTKTNWENLIHLMQKYAKTIGFDRYFGVERNNGSAHAQGKQYKKT